MYHVNRTTFPPTINVDANSNPDSDPNPNPIPLTQSPYMQKTSETIAWIINVMTILLRN